MFVHRSEIPMQFAISVYMILHNRANDLNWSIVEDASEYALEWIKSIYESNDFAWTTQELEWWQTHLSHPILN